MMVFAGRDERCEKYVVGTPPEEEEELPEAKLRREESGAWD